jgi:hypothetical protein
MSTTIPANAQRRSTRGNEENKKTETKLSERTSNIEKKSSFKNNAIEPKANNRSISSSRVVKRLNSKTTNEMAREGTRSIIRSAENNRRTNENNQKVYSDMNRNNEKSRSDNRKSNSDNESKIKSSNEKVIANKSELPRRETGYSYSDRRDNNSRDENTSYNLNRSAGKNSDRYNHNEDDARYKPNREYRGSDKYWSNDLRHDNHGKNHFDKNYSWYKYNHWDRNWETYRWNNNSWRNYYGFYNPYSFRYNKYYYHHHYYGHVIRRFVYQPQIYIHNHIKYYCYDGFFFRHLRGVGYVLVDIPFGFSFDYLPDNYDTVYINGYLYFRIGNLFFENTAYGFSLIHYPERYFSYNDGYSNEGFRFNDMNY